MFKTTLQTLCLFLFVSVFSTGYAQYSSPESVTYDPVGKRYLISNTSSGKIVQRSQAGVVTDFVTAGSGVQGVTYSNGRVYCSVGTRVKGYDLNTSAEILNVLLPFSANDIAADTLGNLYTSNFSSATRKIVKINIASATAWEFTTVPRQPNGVYVDYKRNRLLVASWGSGATIVGVSLTDSTSITPLATTPYSNIDGISLDRNDHVYISSYGAGAVYRYDINFVTTPQLVSSGNGSSCADIFVNRITDTLAIPVAGSNLVNFVALTVPTGIDPQSGNVESYKLSQNYPNPFNPETIINYQLTMSNNVSLKVYDINGKMIESLVEAKQNAGSYSITFNGAGLSSGVYFYELKAGEFTDRKKMLLVK